MFISIPLQFIRESHDMGNCLSKTTLTRRERQLQARSSCQLGSISVSAVNKKGDSTHQILLTVEEDRSTHHSVLSIDSGTNVYHSNVDNEGYKAMLACHDKLVTALATDYLTIAGALLARGFISEEVSAKMLLPSSTPYEKGTILVTAVRERIKIAQQHFLELVKIFSEHTSTKSVVTLLQSAYQANLRSTSAGDNAIPDEFKCYLKTLYASLTPTQVSADTWPPSATRKVINLAMIKSTVVRRGQIQDKFVRQTITGKIDDILQEKYPIQLKDIFNETESRRKVVLLEGAPGCGKSTLSVHISQQWGEGKLFTEFDCVILIRLRDPAVQAASCVADLLPARDDEMRQQAASKICANDGQGVLFILDGWDELPAYLNKDSVFYEMIQPSLMLPQNNPLLHSAVIVTSRPVASGDLHPLVSSRIEILGFTPEELNNYFTECLKGDTKAVEALLERIHENPAIAGSCYLPMNASILVHLFKSDNNTLPTTQYGIFSELVLSCIYRHHNERTQLKNLTLGSLQEIPEALKVLFLFLCKLAYQGIMNDRIIFSDLPAEVNTLGLLQGVESFVRRGKAVSYNFLHLSIQEILAGFYIATQLPDYEQVSKFNELFGKSRFIAVFEFYVAITKLKTPGIKDVVIRAAVEYKHEMDTAIYLDCTPLISLIHCLPEAQDPSLSQSVAQKLECRLELGFTTLTPSDCLCIGCFLSHICLMAAGKFEVNLNSCSIGDQGCKYLASGLCKNPVNVVTTPLTLNLKNNAITHCGVDHLLNIDCIENLQLGDNTFFRLNPSCNGPGPLQATCSFVDQLKSKTMLKRLSLCECGLTPRGVKGLAEALTTNKHLEELDISGNVLDGDGINCLARILSVNQCLKKLCVRKCSITVLSKSFTKALGNNKHFEELNISDNALGDDIYFLAHALGNNQRLKKLVLTTCSLNSISANNLAEALATNTHLEELYINDNPLLNDGIEHLAHALSVNQGLKKLYLRKCSITFLSESFAKALATNMNLEELDISENALGDDILHLVHGIRVNQGLKILHLNTCSFTSTSVKHLAEALTINKHLEALDISGNELCDNSIEHLAHALRINHNVKKLSLNDCRLTSWSAKSFAELLTTNKYLEELDVSNNALDGDSIRCLIHALQVNQKLKSLKMYDYPMTESGLECLAKCLQNNHNLTELVVPCTSSSSSLVNIEKAINDVRMKNGLPIISIKDHNNMS